MRMGVYIHRMVQQNAALVQGRPHRRQRRVVVFTTHSGKRFLHRAPKGVLPWGEAPW